MIEVESKVKVYEIDGSEIDFEKHITVSSCWSDDKMVVLKLGGLKPKSFTVGAGDLRAAIENAVNTRRFG